MGKNNPWSVWTPTKGVTTNYTAGFNDGLLLFNGSSLTCTLPNAASVKVGKTLLVKNLNASTLTVARTSSQTIDGVAANGTVAQYEAKSYISDGTNWVKASVANPAVAYGTTAMTNGFYIKIEDYALTTADIAAGYVNVFMTGDHALTLPTPASALGQVVTVFCTSPGTNGIIPSAGTINGFSRWTNTQMFAGTRMLSDSQDWYVLGQQGGGTTPDLSSYVTTNDSRAFTLTGAIAGGLASSTNSTIVSFSGTNVVINMALGNTAWMNLDTTTNAYLRATNSGPANWCNLFIYRGTNSAPTVNWNTNYTQPAIYGQILTMPTNSAKSLMIVQLIGDPLSGPTNTFTQILKP